MYSVVVEMGLPVFVAQNARRYTVEPWERGVFFALPHKSTTRDAKVPAVGWEMPPPPPHIPLFAGLVNSLVADLPFVFRCRGARVSLLWRSRGLKGFPDRDLSRAMRFTRPLFVV